MPDEDILTLRQADQARTDFAPIETNLEFIAGRGISPVHHARVGPRRGDLATRHADKNQRGLARVARVAHSGAALLRGAGLGLKGTASELASGLRLARSEAIASNRPVVFDLDVTGHLYRVGAGAKRRLPDNLSIELLTIIGENRGARAGDIRFNPDGSSTGGRISLADGKQHVAVGVDWLTGRVSVADLR